MFSFFLFARRVLPVAIVLAACLFPLSALAETRPDREFNAWRTFIFQGDGTVNGMMTIDSDDRNVELQLVKFAGKCKETHLYVFVNFPQPAKQDYSRKDVPGEMRVDTFPVHKTLSNVVYKTGQKSGSYYVKSFENPGQVLQELGQGELVRLKFILDGREYFFRFSLSGFGQAFQRISQLCASGPSTKKKQDDGAKQGKSDADFFGNPKKPEGQPSKSDKDFF